MPKAFQRVRKRVPPWDLNLKLQERMVELLYTSMLEIQVMIVYYCSCDVNMLLSLLVFTDHCFLAKCQKFDL